MKKTPKLILVILSIMAIMCSVLTLSTSAFEYISYDDNPYTMVKNPLPFTLTLTQYDADFDLAEVSVIEHNLVPLADGYSNAVYAGYFGGETEFITETNQDTGEFSYFKIHHFFSGYTPPQSLTFTFTELGYTTEEQLQELIDYLRSVNITIGLDGDTGSYDLTVRLRVSYFSIVATNPPTPEGHVVDVSQSPVLNESMAYGQAINLGDIVASATAVTQRDSAVFSIEVVTTSHTADYFPITIEDIYFDNPSSGVTSVYVDWFGDRAYQLGYLQGINEGQSSELLDDGLAGFLASTTEGILSTDLIGPLSIGDIFLAVVGLLLLVVFLRMFAGG